jgi:pimeloyl-ACP methyl ester carboxylesterase
MPLAHWTVLAASLLAWSDAITIQPSRGDRSSGIQRSISGLDKPSDRTVETLKRFDLYKEYRQRDGADKALQHLEKFAQRRAEPELVYALAELSWIEGNRLDRWRSSQAEAIDRFLDAAAYAHDYLFGKEPELAEGRNRSDPRFRLACEIYNAGVERLIRAAMTKGQIQLQNGEAIPFKVHGREQSLRIVLQESPWNQADIHKILLTSDFEVTGLNKDLYQYGLGVPLIAVRETKHKDGERPPQERFYPDEMAFPLTAFLVPNSRLSDPNVDIKEARECTLKLYDPVRNPTVGDEAGKSAVQAVGEESNKIALEIDLTTPLAYMWSRTDLDRYRWTGLLRPEHALERANLLLIRPYEPGKIPVVMVHGLISTPLAWIPMLNELLRNPKIQDRYQFLLYMYPTGVPIPIAAASLRESLLQAKQLYDPDGRDPAFDQMVLLGHSMGGLLSRMMAVSSGDKLWRLYSDRSFDDILGPRPVLDELRRYFFFEPLPFVSRVVFLATPHGGSEYSRGVVGRVSSNLISEPDSIHKLLYQLVKDNPDAFDSRQFRRFPTSIETLDPEHPILAALQKMKPTPTPPAVPAKFHSIIGSLYPGGKDKATDGVVRYKSASIDGVVDERVVRSDHGVQKDPEAIREVRDILRQHVGLPPVSATARPPQATRDPEPGRKLEAVPAKR